MKYQINENINRFDDFEIIDTVTDLKQRVRFKWCGKNMEKSGTWDYAPLFEMREIGGSDSLDEFRLKLHQDDKYAEQQLIMNRRHDIWWEKHKSEKIKYETSTTYAPHNLSVRIRRPVQYNTRFNNYLMKCYDIDGTKFFFSATLTDKEVMTYQEWAVNLGVYKVFQKFNEFMDSFNSFSYKLKLNLTSDQIQMLKAHKRSEKLLREWLSEDELRWLVYQDELKITYEDEIFIIKKDPHSFVEVIKSDNTKESYCMIPKDSGVAVGDALLSKIMMIKTNPKLFKEIAQKRI